MAQLIAGMAHNVKVGLRMTDARALADAYEAAFRARAPHISLRPERDDDRPFLVTLFKATLPWADALPAPLLDMQAATHNGHCRTAYPAAMYRILERGCEPVGRIALDWVPGDHTMGVDIAILPEIAGTGVGSALLRAWIATADAAGIVCRCTVRADNPARQIYARLGFVTDDGDPGGAMVRMSRPLGG